MNATPTVYVQLFYVCVVICSPCFFDLFGFFSHLIFTRYCRTHLYWHIRGSLDLSEGLKDEDHAYLMTLVRDPDPAVAWATVLAIGLDDVIGHAMELSEGRGGGGRDRRSGMQDAALLLYACTMLSKFGGSLSKEREVEILMKMDNVLDAAEMEEDGEGEGGGAGGGKESGGEDGQQDDKATGGGRGAIRPLTDPYVKLVRQNCLSRLIAMNIARVDAQKRYVQKRLWKRAWDGRAREIERERARERGTYI